MVRMLSRPVPVGALVAVALLSPLFGPRAGRAEAPSEIVWRENLSAAMAEARAQNRPVWVQFSGPWCHFCVRMERETFRDGQLIDHACHRFVPVKLRSDVHETLALRYGLSALPATVLLQPDGQVIDVRQGFAGAAEFRTFLEEALKRSGRPYAPVRVPAARTGDGVALAGFCPVSLVADHRLVPGQPGITVSYDGRIYRFASAQGLESFRRQPERFIPVNSGYCPVAQIDRGEVRGGSPKAGVLYEGHLYLCADDASRQLFLKSPRRYAHVDVADRGFCPHCWSMEKLVVRGRPQCSLTRGGHRYLFPDFKHLEAYRAATETVRR